MRVEHSEYFSAFYLLLFHVQLSLLFILQRFSLCSWISLFYINSFILNFCDLTINHLISFTCSFTHWILFFCTNPISCFLSGWLKLSLSELWSEMQAGNWPLRLALRSWRILPIIIKRRGGKQDWTEEEIALVQAERASSLCIHTLQIISYWM